MDAIKKTFPVRNIRVFPVDLDLSKKCFVRFYVLTGERHRVFVAKRFDTLEARRFEADRIVKDLTDNGYCPDKPKKIAQIVDIALMFDVLDSLKRVSLKTKCQYRKHIVSLQDFCIQNETAHITNQLANNFLDALHVSLSERTVNAYRRTLKGFYERLIKKGRLRLNPFADTDALRTKTAFSEHYSASEMTLILQQVQKTQPWLLLPLLTIYYCFIRNGRELPHIRISDIDFVSGKIWVDNDYAKNHKHEAVLIPKQLMKAFLSAKLHEAPPQYFAFGLKGQPAEKAVSVNYFQAHFKKILQQCAIYKKGKGIYRMKNTGNVALVKANFNRTAIQKQNRHASFTTTEHYIALLRVDDFSELKDNFPPPI